MLPEVDSYMPTDNGESPLAAMTDWVNTTCPCCGGPAKRETDTMPQWAGSSWYFLRYTDPHNDEALASPEALKYWMPVDWYNGGMEHVTRHMIYSRFWHHFLYDMVIVNAGSSAGTEEFTVHVVRELGEVLVHGVAIKPGKPVILAIVNGKPVIGLPGYPVSAYINFENFVIPVLQKLAGRTETAGTTVRAVISKRLVSSLKHKEYVRVKVGEVGDKLVASPLARGAGAAMSLVRADGFCVIPQNSEGVEAGDTVDVELYRSLEEIGSTAVAIGSHDLILDVMADLLPCMYPGNYLSSTHVGSMGGLMALKRGEAHLAPTHLLDEETGEYNIAILKKLFAGEKMALVKGVERIQGIIVKKGNPLGIHEIEDLRGLNYVNRQRGAGTRVLFDYKLKEAGISPEEIHGYDREAATHMAVAAAVSGGDADAGMGIQSAARAMGLDFIEVGREEYDFAIPVRFLDFPPVQHFLAVLKSREFAERVEKLGGYGLARTGEILYL